MIIKRHNRKSPDDSELRQYSGANTKDVDSVESNTDTFDYLTKVSETKAEKVINIFKPMNTKFVIVVVAATFAITMLMIPLIFLFFHTHDYQLVHFNPSTCTAYGSKVYECTRCKNSYIEEMPYLHPYVVIEQDDSTCISEGYRRLKCPDCDDVRTEIIPIKEHNYLEATCTDPKICLMCGKINEPPLGHTNSVNCLRCGELTFKTITYSGSGVGNVTGVDLPIGTYNITVTHSGNNYFLLYLNNTLVIYDHDEVSYVYRYTTEGLRDGYFNIRNADGDWTITIERIGN